MTFATPLPWWILVLVVCAAGATGWLAYRHLAAPARRKNTLIGIRVLSLLLLVLFLMRPIATTDDRAARDAIVPILVDTSRSMSIQDAAGVRRIDRARAIVSERLLPALNGRFRTEILGFGDALAPVTPDKLAATARRTDLGTALAAIRERYRGQVIAGAVLVTDGGDTAGTAERAAGEAGVPVYPIAVGSRTLSGDREVLSVTAAEAVMDDSRVDLAVSAVSHTDGAGPIQLRLLENGRPIEVRRPVPAGSGTPVREVFQVFPRRGAATVYTVETDVAPGELVPENNARSVLIQGPSRSRRILLVEGAPGFEHSFLKRALAVDSGLEIDSVIRKGRNEQGTDTFYIQAARSRSDALTSGYPVTPESLFVYDALVLANVDGAMLTRAQLDATRDFVSRRGGGLLVLGARSFLRQGLMDTSLEEALPLQLGDRERGGVLPAAASRGMNRVALTAEGVVHPIMQLAGDPADTRKRWDAAPALAAIAPLGGPRPGASVLAVTSGAGGAARALVAVQRYGEGRTMVFAGEAAWRWRMMLPATDRSYDTFWRQSVRWLALPASDPLTVTVPPSGAPGDLLPLRVLVRDAAYQPMRGVDVDVRVSPPDGRLEHLRAAPEAGADGDGRFVVAYRPTQPGVYRVTAEAHNSGQSLGSASSAMLVGGADVEMTDPRVNNQLLQRVALASNGRVTEEADAASLADSLVAKVPAAALAVRRDLWHNGWSFTAILMLLASEWILRRRWGLR